MTICHKTTPNASKDDYLVSPPTCNSQINPAFFIGNRASLDPRGIASSAGAKESLSGVVVGNNWVDPHEVRIKVKAASSLYGPTEGRNADETDCSPA